MRCFHTSEAAVTNTKRDCLRLPRTGTTAQGIWYTKSYTSTLKSTLLPVHKVLHTPPDFPLTLTDFYDIPALKKLAAKQFRRAVDPIRDPLPIKLIVYINETTPENDRGLRDITVEWYLCRMPRVIFMEGDSIGKATVQVPAFASDVLTLIESKATVCAYCMDLSTDGWGSRCSCQKRDLACNDAWSKATCGWCPPRN